MYYKSIYVLVVLAILNSGCSPAKSATAKATSPSGVCLSFDDRFVDDWVKADSLFRPQYNWRATFFITGYDKISPAQEYQLKRMQDEGHEIGFHGDRHVSAVPFIETHSLTEYLEKEFTQLDGMRKAGFPVSSFAYPSGSRNDATDSALLQKFTMLRGVTNKVAVSKDSSCFYNGSPVVDGIGIEEQYNYFSKEYLLSLLDDARKSGRVAIFYGHRLLPVADKKKHEVSYETVQLICEYVRKHNMKFYTMKELSATKH